MLPNDKFHFIKYVAICVERMNVRVHASFLSFLGKKRQPNRIIID
jgi:hypothetical protein